MVDGDALGGVGGDGVAAVQVAGVEVVGADRRARPVVVLDFDAARVGVDVADDGAGAVDNAELAVVAAREDVVTDRVAAAGGLVLVEVELAAGLEACGRGR